MSFMSRTIDTAVEHQLFGSLVHVRGTAVIVRKSNPFRKTKCLSHQWMVLVKDAVVGSVAVDHFWMHGCKRIKDLRDAKMPCAISLTGHVSSYVDKGLVKWTVTFPYRNLTIGPCMRTRDDLCQPDGLPRTCSLE
jgi:hypothetical protein